MINNDQMTELLDKRHVDFDQKDLAYLKDLKSFVEFNNGKFIVPDYFMFNKEGHLINSGFNQDQCGYLIKSLDEKLFKIDENQTLDAFAKQLAFMDKEQAYQDKDYVVFITWAAFAPKGANKGAFRDYTYVKEHYDNVQVYLLNLDVNEAWNLTDKQKEALHL